MAISKQYIKNYKHKKKAELKKQNKLAKDNEKTAKILEYRKAKLEKQQAKKEQQTGKKLKKKTKSKKPRKKKKEDRAKELAELAEKEQLTKKEAKKLVKKRAKKSILNESISNIKTSKYKPIKKIKSDYTKADISNIVNAVNKAVNKKLEPTKINPNISKGLNLASNLLKPQTLQKPVLHSILHYDKIVDKGVLKKREDAKQLKLELAKSLINYDYKVDEKGKIERKTKRFDPEKLRNITKTEKLTADQIIKENDFIKQYNKQVDKYGEEYEKHKIDYIKLGKIMDNHGYVSYDQIDSFDVYIDKKKQIAIDNTLKTLSSAGLKNTDYYEYVKQHLNSNNIDDVFKKVDPADIYDFYGSDQTKAVETFQSFLVNGLGAKLTDEFNGRTIADIIGEAKKKI